MKGLKVQRVVLVHDFGVPWGMESVKLLTAFLYSQRDKENCSMKADESLENSENLFLVFLDG